MSFAKTILQLRTAFPYLLAGAGGVGVGITLHSRLVNPHLSAMGSSDGQGPAHLHNEQAQPLSLKHKVLDSAAAMTQNFQPVNQIHQHVCGFHFYSGDLARQVEAHHYCSHLNDEMRQCVIYDSDGSGARLIGVEYIISERLFKTLSEDEKKYWHSHAYEVTSGTLTTPMTDLLPSAAATAAEKLEMSQLVNTYGKTFHLWQVDRGDQLPLGPPQLMMSFTKDGQLRRDLLQDRDTRYGIDSGTKRAERANLVPNAKVAGADGWETSGVAVQLEPRQVKMRMG